MNRLDKQRGDRERAEIGRAIRVLGTLPADDMSPDLAASVIERLSDEVLRLRAQMDWVRRVLAASDDLGIQRALRNGVRDGLVFAGVLLYLFIALELGG